MKFSRPSKTKTRLLLLGIVLVVVALLCVNAMVGYLDIPIFTSTNDNVQIWVICGLALVTLTGWVVSVYVSLPNKTRIMLLGIAFVVIALLGAIAMGRYLDTPMEGSINDYVRTWVIYGAALVALLGWVVSAYVSLSSSIKQHTVNILLQSRLSTAFNDHKDAILSVYPNKPKIILIPGSDIRKLDNGTLTKKKFKALDSLTYILNHFEFIAAGIHHGDLDEALLKSCLRNIICSWCEKSDDYINYVRGKDKNGVFKKPKVYEHLLALRDKWKN